MNLATHQRTLLGLIRDNPAVQLHGDPYFLKVACSPDLQEARGNIALWRVYVLERTCVLTVELLRQNGHFDAVLQEFIRTQNLSPFREYQPLAFLAALDAHPDPLLASVSQFELALMKVRDGDPGIYEVDWTVNPYEVLHGLAQRLPFVATSDGSHYLTRVAGHLPHHFEVERQEQYCMEEVMQALARGSGPSVAAGTSA